MSKHLILSTSLSFQDSWSPVMSQISSFHHHVMVVICFIISAVVYIFSITFTQSCKSQKILKNESLELIWTCFPAVVLAFLAVPSLFTLYLIDEVKTPSLTLKITGNQWYWTYQYDDFSELQFNSYMIADFKDLPIGGFRLLEVDNNTILPCFIEIRAVISSSDVIHSWTLPSLGVKVDAVPGRLNQLSLFSSRVGLNYGQCSEICGALHSFMPICVEWVTVDAFVSWVQEFCKKS
nr:cytochrome c oxidase subunit 2 [Oxylipeurus chiniri]